MPLFSCGISYQSTSIDIRERFAVNNNQATGLLNELCRLEAVNEAVLLSTCNRTEIYMAGDSPQALQHWFGQPCYTHQDLETVRHLLRVSSGLDSMVLGEPQIFGQLKQAYRIACEAGTVGQQLGHLFASTFASSKQIRHQTQISANPVSMAYATLQLAKRIFTHLPNCCVLLIGAGELMELMVTHLSQQGVQQLIVANRTTSKAASLAGQQGRAIRIGEIPSYLNQVDIVISATASQLPIIGKGLVERILKMRKRRPILMVDLAVPRDIEPEVGQLTDVYLYNVDDLQAIIDVNLKNRQQAAKQAEALVELQAAHYMRQLHILNIGDIISQFRYQAEQHRDQSVQKALQDLNQGKNPELIISQLGRQLTNKILHQPTIKLRQAAYHQQAGVLRFAKELLTSSDG